MQEKKKTYGYVHHNRSQSWRRDILQVPTHSAVWSACVLFHCWVPGLSRHQERGALPGWWMSLVRFGHCVWNNQPCQPTTHNQHTISCVIIQLIMQLHFHTYACERILKAQQDLPWRCKELTIKILLLRVSKVCSKYPVPYIMWNQREKTCQRGY